MTITKEALAALITATMKDSVDYRYEILERAGAEELFDDVRDLPETVKPFVNGSGEQMISVRTENDQLFELIVKDYGIMEHPSDYMNKKHGLEGHDVQQSKGKTAIGKQERVIIDEYPSTTFEERMDEILAEKHKAGIPKTHALIAEVRKQVANERGISL